MSARDYYFDLGNTRAKFWSCRGGEVEAYWAGAHEGAPERLLESLPPEFQSSPRGVFGCSVLDGEGETRFSRAVEARWGLAPRFARTGVSFGAFRNGYTDEPLRLGVDRWLGMIGAAGDCDVLCVVGCGTAVTIDVVDRNTHKGGYILPGMYLMQDSLLAGTRKVRFEQSEPRSLDLGTSTGSAVRNAAAAAVVALIERVVVREQVERLVLTGGDADVLASLLSVPCEVDPGLLLKGMMRYFAHRNGGPEDRTPHEVGG